MGNGKWMTTHGQQRKSTPVCLRQEDYYNPSGTKLTHDGSRPYVSEIGREIVTGRRSLDIMTVASHAWRLGTFSDIREIFCTI